MATKRDFYEILGVSRDATEDQIKSAYKKLAIRFHPDKNPDDSSAEEKFKEAAEAFDVLRDPEKRAKYDRFGHQAFEGGGGGGAGGFSSYEDIFSRFSDIFGDSLFGGMFGGGGRGGQRRGRDLQVKVALTLEEIATGVTKKIRVRRLERCGSCEGKGGSGARPCSSCGGQGQVRQVGRSLFGQVVNIVTCPACHGAGNSFSETCKSCQGEGVERREATLSVTIPAGVSEGNYLSLRGEGDRGSRGAPPGDLIVLVEEKLHDFYRREGSDLHAEVAVGFPTVALGGSVRVPLLGGGAIDLRIPSGTQVGKVFQVRGKGLPLLEGSGQGNLLVRVRVAVPEKLNARQRKLLEELAETDKDHEGDHPRGATLLERVAHSLFG